MQKFSDIDVVRQTIKSTMALDEFISIADKKYTQQTGKSRNPIEYVNDNLSKKRCDLDSHPVDNDGSRDSTASFTICPPKELWHCFGCGSGGDRFAYIQAMFNVDHGEAIIISAEIVNLDLSPYYTEITPEEQVREQLFKENEKACEIAHIQLRGDHRAIEYLHKRGITDESIELFRIGYAPPLDNNRVIMFNNIANSIALQLDRTNQFNDAILFPITDVYGRMRYFQSRPFSPLPGMKYIGGDDTHPLYDETDRIFGFNISRKQLYINGGRLIGVEGAPDTIACIQAGIPAVGFMGTVVNQNTFLLLDKYRVNELVLLLDGDKAGRDRSYKIAEKYLAIQTNVRLRIAVLPDGYDPDDFINKYGVDELNSIINSALYAIQYLIDYKWNNATSPTDKLSFISDVQPYMNMVTNKIMRSIMINDIAGKLGLDPVQVEDHYTQQMVNINGAKLYSPDGEEIILGEALRNADFITELTVRFKDDDWYLLRHKYLFRILSNTQYIDIESIYTIAKNMNVDNIITYQWLDYLYNKHGNVDFSLNDVEDKLMRRRAVNIIDTAKVSVHDMGTDTTIILDKTTTDIYNVVHRKVDDKIFDSKQQVNSVMKLIHERMLNDSAIIGYSLGNGFMKTTTAILGLQSKTLTIVAANQSVGKTQLCGNWAMAQTTIDKIPVLWFSLEMDKDLMTFRNLSVISGVPCDAIMTGNITVEQKFAIDKASIVLENSPFYLSNKGYDLYEALSIARRYVMRYSVKIIYVDYIQLQYISDNRNAQQRHRELGMISKAWKQFSLDMDCAVVCISQLSKEALHAITAEAEHGAGSYEIAQDADNYITLKEKSQEEIDQRGIDHGNITLNISKNRMGEKSILLDIYADRPVHRMIEL